MGDRDPLHRQILERLGGDLNPRDFEEAVCDLLRDTFPSLVPIRGGSDSGRDGAIADGEGETYPLVCTTGADVIGNLTDSLDSYLSDGGRRRKVVLATSQALTPKRRSNLERRAVEKGFTLVQIIERHGLAQRLFRDAGWRKKLLGLSGSPEALSAVPLSKRPFLEMTPVGREEDLHWLRTTIGDRVLSGQPGAGKTFLLQHLIREGWPGLFLVGRSETEIANALRAQAPGFTVIVDDAHANLDALVRLRRLRKETEAEFDILATTWEGNRDSVLEALGSPIATRELELLARNEILEVYRQAGISEDNTDRDLLRELVDQASNRPGLAVTLALLWLRGGWEEVLSVKALGRHVRETFRSLIGDKADVLLAAFAVGGERGMPLTAVGEFLQIGLADLWSQTSALAAGGVLTVIEGEVLAVRPHQLRSALIWAVFFPDPGSGIPLSCRPLLDRAPSLGSAVTALVQARIYGVPVPNTELRELVLRADALDSWRQMAERDRDLGKLILHSEVFAAWQGLTASSEENARWSLEHYPGDVLNLAPEALLQAPRQIIHHLLSRASGFRGPVHSYPDHPLSVLEHWIQEPLSTLQELTGRRKLLAEEIARFLRAGGDPTVGLKAISLALSPKLEASSLDPGLGNRILWRWGRLPDPMLPELGNIWAAVRDTVSCVPVEAWPSVAKMLWEWIDPKHIAPRVPISEEAIRSFRGLAAGVIADLAPLVRSSPGLSAELRKLGARLDLTIDLPVDHVFEILYPEPDLEADHEPEPPDLGDLVAVWSREAPRTVALRLARYEDEARQTNRRWPRYTPVVCRELAARVSSPEEWLAAWAMEGLTGDLAEPFFLDLVQRRPEGWDALMEAWLGAELWADTAASVLAGIGDLHAPLEERALAVLRARPWLVYILARRHQVAVPMLGALLRSSDWEAALAAAAGAWSAHPRKSIPPEVNDDWRRAILRAEAEVENPSVQYSLAQILEEDRDLAFEWLRVRIPTGPIPLSLSTDERGPFRTALAVLDAEQRRVLLDDLVPSRVLRHLLPHLIGRNASLYKQLLGRADLQDYHLDPLQGLPGPEWVPLALAAAAAGWAPRSIAYAAIDEPGAQFFRGSEAEHWTRWHRSFAALDADPHEEIRAIGRAGQALVEPRIQKARAEEGKTALEGL